MHFTVTYNFFVFGDPERAFITPFLQLFYLNRISIIIYIINIMIKNGWKATFYSNIII